MRPKQIDIDPANANTAGIFNDATGAGPFTSASLTYVAAGAGDGLAHQISIDTAANLSGITFTVVGTDADDKPITEDITGPNATLGESTGFFKTVTSITASSTLGANTMDVGWVDEFTTKTYPLDHYRNNPASLAITLTGTMGFDVEVSLENPWGKATDDPPFAIDEQADLNWFNDANFTAKSASLANNLAMTGLRAMRVVANSYTDTAELQVFLTQSE